jgi:hypothetical protein
MPESLKNHDTWGAQVCRVGTRKCTTYQVLSIFTGESGIWCQKPESVVRPYSYYSRTGGNDDDERPINGHTAVSRYRSELCITDLSGAGE